MSVVLGPFSLDRVGSAVEKVRQRLLRAAAALWVSRADEAAVRNTQDVDILLRREDLGRATVALEAAGFIYPHTAGLDVFLDGPGTKPCDAVHVVFANEKVRPHEPSANPDVTDSEPTEHYRVLSLEALVRVMLAANRREDLMNLRDMISVGLIDVTWPARYSRHLGERLQSLLDDPEG